MTPIKSFTKQAIELIADAYQVNVEFLPSSDSTRVIYTLVKDENTIGGGCVVRTSPSATNNANLKVCDRISEYLATFLQVPKIEVYWRSEFISDFNALRNYCINYYSQNDPKSSLKLRKSELLRELQLINSQI